MSWSSMRGLAVLAALQPAAAFRSHAPALNLVSVPDVLRSVEPPYGFAKYRGSLRHQPLRLEMREGAGFELFRQGEASPQYTCDAAPCTYSFTPGDEGHWFTAVARGALHGGSTDDLDFFVAAPKFEGGRFFTQRSLDCGAWDAPRELPPFALEGRDRHPFGFAVELEMDARPPGGTGPRGHDLSLLSRVFEDGGALYMDPVHPKTSPGYYSDLHGALEQCFREKTGGGSAAYLRRGWHFTVEMNAQPVQYKELLELRGLAAGNASRGPGALLDQMLGVCFELVSPGPGAQGVLQGRGDGMLQVFGVMEALRAMGVQAIIRGALQVHVNAMKFEACFANGRRACQLLKPREVFAVWVLYAKYQRVIDEMLDSRRVQNNYARGLHLSDPDMQRVFRNGYHMLRQGARLNRSGVCAALIGGDCDSPENPWAHRGLRYSALNVAALPRLGTVEFRQHAATTETERVLRWVQFCLGLVAAARRAVRAGQLDEFIRAGDADEGLERLRGAQRAATHAALFGELRGLVAKDSEAFYRSGRWRATPIEALEREGGGYLGNGEIQDGLLRKLAG